jgi:hypothetical protein
MDKEDFMFKGLTVSPVSQNRFSQYLELFRDTFPDFVVNEAYLEWLYLDNPLGQFVGFDACLGDEVVSHYACIPTRIDSHSGLSLLALNTATRSDYQGRGLLKVLANATYSKYESEFSCVVGVANAKAVGALTRHLGFYHLGNLELRFGRIYDGASRRRLYSNSDLNWRTTSPKLPIKISRLPNNMALLSVKPYKFFLPIRSIVPIADTPALPGSQIFPKFGFTLDWRRGRKPLVYLPSRLKPSPLALVYRPLKDDLRDNLDAWSFPDFDAF